MKMNGCIKLFRKELELEKKLTDPEQRLYHLYRRLADWDKKHENFGLVDVSYRKLLAFLPTEGWQPSKISRDTNGLIEKKLIEKTSDGKIRILNMNIFQAPVSVAEHLIPLIEQGVHSREHDVRNLERLLEERVDHRRHLLAQQMRIP